MFFKLKQMNLVKTPWLTGFGLLITPGIPRIRVLQRTATKR